jgi:hypothetical protein
MPGPVIASSRLAMNRHKKLSQFRPDNSALTAPRIDNFAANSISAQFGAISRFWAR